MKTEFNSSAVSVWYWAGELGRYQDFNAGKKGDYCWCVSDFWILVLASLKVWNGRGRSPEHQPGLNCELEEKVIRTKHKRCGKCNSRGEMFQLSVPTGHCHSRVSKVPLEKTSAGIELEPADWVFQTCVQPTEAPLSLGHWSRIPDEGRKHHREPESFWGQKGQPGGKKHWKEGRIWGLLWAMGRTEEVWEISREFC